MAKRSFPPLNTHLVSHLMMSYALTRHTRTHKYPHTEDNFPFLVLFLQLLLFHPCICSLCSSRHTRQTAIATEAHNCTIAVFRVRVANNVLFHPIYGDTFGTRVYIQPTHKCPLGTDKYERTTTKTTTAHRVCVCDRPLVSAYLRWGIWRLAKFQVAVRLRGRFYVVMNPFLCQWLELGLPLMVVNRIYAHWINNLLSWFSEAHSTTIPFDRKMLLRHLCATASMPTDIN